MYHKDYEPGVERKSKAGSNIILTNTVPQYQSKKSKAGPVKVTMFSQKSGTSEKSITIMSKINNGFKASRLGRYVARHRNTYSISHTKTKAKSVNVFPKSSGEGLRRPLKAVFPYKSFLSSLIQGDR